MKTNSILSLNKLALSVFLGLFLGVSSVHATDVEVYRTLGSTQTVKPNLLFVLDESSSMASKDGDSSTRTEELQEALRAIFADPENGGIDEVNAAFMGYSKREYGGRRLITNGSTTGFFDVDEDRATLMNKIDNIYHISGTVTVQAMKAAVEWFQSGFTDNDGTDDYDGCYKDRGNCIKGTGVGFDLSVTTPVTSELYCAQNSIILLTDGEPWSHQSATSNIDYRDPNPFHPNYIYQGVGCTNPDPGGFSMERAGCTGDIAEWAFNNDLFPGIDEVQNVITHTIGFHTTSGAKDYLLDIATRGGGTFFESSNTAGLVTAFNAISKEAKKSITYTFNAPLVPFNATNTAVTGEFIYVPVFEPSVTAFWRGNLKKYGLSVDDSNITLSSAAGGGTVLDSNNLFMNTAKSYWSNGTDGYESLSGGAITNFVGTRKLYTYVSGSTSVNLADNPQNHVIDTNSLITHDLLGVPTPTNINDSSNPYNILRKDIIQWANWTDDLNAHEGEMGASIHSSPAVVDTYGAGRDVILVPTTEGVLEAIDAESGVSLWAFMPEAMLSKIDELKTDAKRDEPLYGLDGPMTVYQVGGKTMVVVGMRRGGRNYYALDITNRVKPEFAWEIIGGEVGRFINLGQTWSKPLSLKMEVPDAPLNKQVLVFGGGYDPAQDGSTSRVSNQLGRGMYVVNAATGEWIATYTPSGNLNSVAADLLPVDINANGITDRFYAADVGGRILRIDTPDSGFTSQAITLGVIADVNAGETTYHQFFNTPEVGYYNKGSTQQLMVLIGSGARPNPLDKTVTDSFYMIKDPDIWTAPGTYDTVLRNELHDTTSNLVQVGNVSQQNLELAALGSSKGWYMNMPTGSGEKIFSKASLYDFAVLFTTYSGTRSVNADACSAGATIGEAKFWAVNMLTGAAVFAEMNDEDANTLDTLDRTKSLNIPGMPPSPTLLFPGSGSGPGKVVVALVGLQEVSRWPDRFHAIYWEEVIDYGTTIPE